jgi:hypothetical protein
MASSSSDASLQRLLDNHDALAAVLSLLSTRELALASTVCRDFNAAAQLAGATAAVREWPLMSFASPVEAKKHAVAYAKATVLSAGPPRERKPYLDLSTLVFTVHIVDEEGRTVLLARKPGRADDEPEDVEECKTITLENAAFTSALPQFKEIFEPPSEEELSDAPHERSRPPLFVSCYVEKTTSDGRQVACIFSRRDETDNC